MKAFSYKFNQAWQSLAAIAGGVGSRVVSATEELKDDQKGIAAVEFSLVVPLILFSLMSSVGLFDLYKGSRSFDDGSSTIVDLVTRQNEMDDEKFELIVATAESLMGRYVDSTDFEIVISSVENVFDSDNDPTLTVTWSRSNKDSGEIKDADLVNFDLPPIPEGNSVILVDISSSYTPYIMTDEVGLIEFERSVVRRPRFVDIIPYLAL